MKNLWILLFLFALIMLSGCGSNFSDKGGYNISGVGLVPERKMCYDSIYDFTEDGPVLEIDTSKCRTGKNEWSW